METRLSDLSSSSSDDERPSFGRTANYTPGNDLDARDQSRRDEGAPFSDSPDGRAKKRRSSADSDNNFEAAIKKARTEEDTEARDKAERMMAKMGYKKGAGLGKHGQGRLEPVEASKHKGRRGLGHYNDKLKDANLRWDPSEEVVSVREDMEWLNNSREPPETEQLNRWMGLGPSKKTIDDESTFCDANIVMQVVNSKSVFDNLDKHEMRRARTRSNPYETIRGSIFLNRAAVKMANMDRACDFMFTEPNNLQPGELLYFADVCAGPGGFSEYVLWRKRWHAKGFGFTLRESNDFKLDDFYAGPSETFHPYYGPQEDGDVYSPANQTAFKELIMRQTKGKGVHFMMSDGGFSVEGQESIQEILSKQLYLCQCLVALMIVRNGGNFVTKVFDLFTPFSAGLVYLMHRCFESISIFKPNTSRPANSERYLICKGKLSNVQPVIEHLARANRIILEKKASCDVMELVPHDVLESDAEFFGYLKNSNDSLGKKQVVGLLKIAAFCEDTTLFEARQAEMRKECLKYWKLPEETRKVPMNEKPEDRLKSIVKGANLRFLSSKTTELKTSNFESVIVNAHNDWMCMPCGSGQNTDDEKAATFYLGLGRSKTFRYSKDSWMRVPNLELPADTLVYAELIPELRGDHRHQRKTWGLHILDSYVLGKEDVGKKHLEDRHELTKLFCEALWKPIKGTSIPVRTKELHSLTINLGEKLALKPCTMKNGHNAEAYVPSTDPESYENDGDQPYYFVPNSLLFLKGTGQYWTRQVSSKSGRSYYFHCKANKAMFDADRPAEANASFPESMETRMVWHWRADPALPLESIVRLIQEKCSVSKK